MKIFLFGIVLLTPLFSFALNFHDIELEKSCSTEGIISTNTSSPKKNFHLYIKYRTSLMTIDEKDYYLKFLENNVYVNPYKYSTYDPNRGTLINIIDGVYIPDQKKSKIEISVPLKLEGSYAFYTILTHELEHAIYDYRKKKFLGSKGYNYALENHSSETYDPDEKYNTERDSMLAESVYLQFNKASHLNSFLKGLSSQVPKGYSYGEVFRELSNSTLNCLDYVEKQQNEYGRYSLDHFYIEQ